MTPTFSIVPITFDMVNSSMIVEMNGTNVTVNTTVPRIRLTGVVEVDVRLLSCGNDFKHTICTFCREYLRLLTPLVWLGTVE